jgi:hypothetical protein
MSLAVLGLFGAGAHADFTTSTTSSQAITAGTWGAPTATITQVAPFGGLVVQGTSFSDQLETSDSASPTLTFTQTSTAIPGLAVSSSGQVSATSGLAAGTYTLSGTDSDSSTGASGTWGYTLSVIPTIIQEAPFGGSVPQETPLAAQLHTSDGASPTLTFAQVASSSPDLSVSSSGEVSGTATLPPGTYTVTGTDVDSATLATGTWGFTLSVTSIAPIITQVAPFGGTAVQGTSFSDQLATSDGASPTLTFTQTSTAISGLGVNSSGQVSATSGLVAGTYTVSGTDSDSSTGDSGTWGYTLSVIPAIIQEAPFGGTTPVGVVFGAQLRTDDSCSGGPVFAEESSSNPGLSVNPSGQVSGSDTLRVGTYSVTGTDQDACSLASDTWGFTLTVSAVPIVQMAPFAGAVTTAGSAAFTDQLATDGSGVTFNPLSNGALAVSSAGVVTTTGKLAAGTYSISGTDADGLGDSGSWSYTLVVSRVLIVQVAPFGASVVATNSAAFTDHLATNASDVTFKPVSTASLRVSSAGVVTTTGKLATDTYSISGTDSDKLGARGTWSFTLVVTASAPTGGPPIVAKVAPHVTIAAVGPWTLFANKHVHFRIHLYGSRGKVSGVVRLLYGRRTLCARQLVNGIDHCTVSSTKIGRGRRWLKVAYAGSGFYKAHSFRRNVYVH